MVLLNRSGASSVPHAQERKITNRREFAILSGHAALEPHRICAVAAPDRSVSNYKTRESIH
jgi:hypothetical protein